MTEVDSLLAVLSHRLLNDAAALKGLIATIQTVLDGHALPEPAASLLDVARLRADRLAGDLEHTVRGLVPPAECVDEESSICAL